MKTIDLHAPDLLKVWSKVEPTEKVSFAFAINAETGATRASVAYAELAPGGAIPTHFDSANEVDGGTETVAPGKLVQIAGGSRHRVVNTGDDAARMLFFFDEAADTVTFDEPLMPLDLAVIGGPA